MKTNTKIVAIISGVLFCLGAQYIFGSPVAGPAIPVGGSIYGRPTYVGTWCHLSDQRKTNIAQKDWQKPSLPWIGAPFKINFGGSVQGNEIKGGQWYTCQHFLAEDSEAQDNSWFISEGRGGSFTLTFRAGHIPAGVYAQKGQRIPAQFVYQEAVLSKVARRVSAKPTADGGIRYTFKAKPDHQDHKSTVENFDFIKYPITTE